MRNRFAYIILLFFFCLKAGAQAYTIYPIPQKMMETDGHITMTSTVNIVYESGVDGVITERLEEVLENAGLAFVKSNEPVADKTNIFVGTNGSGSVADTYATANAISRAVFQPSENKFDAHVLQVNSNHAKGDILILGDETGSAYYAMATLEQMLEQRTAAGRRLAQVTVEDYAYTQYRGIVEGFYGRPYTVENRLSLLDFCKRYKMNVYVYGPKSDPYHLGKWREEYPATLTERERYFGLITQDDVRQIATKAQACHVDFVWAAHPALENGIGFGSNADVDRGVNDILDKFEHMHQLGVRSFGIFIDDMNYTPAGDKQAYLADQAQKKLVEKFNGAGTPDKDKVTPLFFVPTAYALNYGASYTLTSLKTVDQDVVIAFTGYDCFSNIRGSACQDMANRVGRNAVMWWNNPVNDDHDDRIYMREVTCHWTIEDKDPIPSLHGLIMNPMCQGQASKVALFGGADYSWNPAKFNTKTNWEAFFGSVFVGDDELGEALKTFALSSNSLVEEESLRQLYESFKTNYSKEQLPQVSDELLQEMQKINEACSVLETMKESDNKDYALLYEDIRCWVAKLKSMTGIISKSLSLMKNEGDLSAWTYFSDVQKEYAKLHTDSAFLVSAFEGAGTNTYEKYYEVHPSQTYMEPFVEYIVGKLSDYSPRLPEKPSGNEIITNKEELPSSIVLTEDNGLIKLVGLESLSLAPGEYAGINFNMIKSAVVTALPGLSPEGLVVQYSLSGKEWTTFIPDGETPVDMAYVRIKNSGDTEQPVADNELSISTPSAGSAVVKEVTTNMSTYSSYRIQNVIDGNNNSYFWKNGPQAVGDYVMLDYGEAAARYGVVLQFNSGDYITGQARVELSDDSRNWTSVATFSPADLSDEYVYSCNAGGRQARYVRLIIESVSGGNWFQLAEFTVDAARVIAVAQDDKGNQLFALNDRSLTTSYKAETAGYLIYRFIENIKIDKVSIYHYSDFVSAAAIPSVSIYAGGEWINRWKLEDYCTVIDVSDLKNVSQLKISWDAENLPDIYEIMPEGEAYKEEPGTGMDELKDNKLLITLDRNGLCRVEVSKPISTITVYDFLGRTLTCEQVDALSGSFATPAGSGVLFVKVNFTDKDIVVNKVLY